MRAVLLPIPVGYGTTVRLLAVGNELRKRGHEAIFASAERVGHVVEQYGFRWRPITSVSIDDSSDVPQSVQVLRGEAGGDLLRHQVEDAQCVIREFHADVVVFSNNNAAALAAAAEGLPSVSIWHPSVMQYHDVPSGVATVLKWRKFFAVKEQFELKRDVPSSLLGDLNFIPSIPPLAPWPWTQPPEILFRDQPTKIVGALLRTTPEELPDQEHLKREFGADGGKFVYASMGGAVGTPQLLRVMVDGLRRSGHKALLTAGGQVPAELMKELSDEQVQVIRFLPEAMRAIKACDVLVWHGGHETMMEGVAAGKPAIGIPVYYDQDENSTRIAKLGAGLKIPRSILTAGALAAAINEIIANPSYRSRALHLKRINDSLGGVVRLVDSTEALVCRGRRV